MPQMLHVEVYENAKEAIQAGRIYREGHTSVVLKTAVIVREGTQEGNPTVDFIMEDEKGNKYVAVVTMGLLQTLAGVVR